MQIVFRRWWETNMGTSQGAVVSVIKMGVGVPAAICGVSDRDSAALREMLMTRIEGRRGNHGGNGNADCLCAGPN